MLNENHIAELKSKYPNPDQLVRMVNSGSHCEAIKAAREICLGHSRRGLMGATQVADSLLDLLVSCVTEEVILEDTGGLEWMSVKDWVRKNPKVNPKDAGWMLEGDQLYRKKFNMTKNVEES